MIYLERMVEDNMQIFEIISNVDIDKIQNEIGSRAAGQRQFPLQGAYENDFFGALGPVDQMEHEETKYTYNLYEKDMPYTYSVLNEFNMFRTRHVSIPANYCYDYHNDATPRIHIPLQSNEDCFMVIDDNVYRMPSNGDVYKVNTTKKHLALNASYHGFIRTHLIGNII